MRAVNTSTYYLNFLKVVALFVVATDQHFLVLIVKLT